MAVDTFEDEKVRLMKVRADSEEEEDGCSGEDKNAGNFRFSSDDETTFQDGARAITEMAEAGVSNKCLDDDSFRDLKSQN